MMQSSLFPANSEEAGADFSPCRIWRYTCWRHWDRARGYVNFLMLNPSTADEHVLDPTLRRCARYARDWGYGGFVVTNLFALRSTDPRGLRWAIQNGIDPVGEMNDVWIPHVARRAGRVIAAWGAHGTFLGRDRAVKELLRISGIDVYALQVTKAGHPGHPLYLPADAEPATFQLGLQGDR